MKVKPTESELEIMQILWEKGPFTVREVNDRLNLSRRVGYTTTLKIMQLMTEKKILTRNTDERSHIYSPTIEPEEVQSTIVDHILRTVFNGNRSTLVLQALGNHSASEKEMDEIRTLLDKLEGKEDGIL